jgi:hypothetical protein
MHFLAIGEGERDHAKISKHLLTLSETHNRGAEPGWTRLDHSGNDPKALAGFFYCFIRILNPFLGVLNALHSLNATSEGHTRSSPWGPPVAGENPSCQTLRWPHPPPSKPRCRDAGALPGDERVRGNGRERCAVLKIMSVRCMLDLAMTFFFF